MRGTRSVDEVPPWHRYGRRVTICAPRLATPDDVDEIHALRRSLEDWMARRGTIQWPPGSLPRERIAAQVDAGEWHLVADAAGIVGTIRLLWSDPDFWGSDALPAVYVHGLMVDRRATGRGIGTALLDWAADRGRAAGVGRFRLDCRTTNPVLRAYYEAYGFTAVGRRDFADFSCTLLELAL
jgi:ribosomal protein S18 acetylase RimI-like enzyme